MGLALSEKTIGDHMKEEGYRTLAVGKWHLGNEAKFFPLKSGFDEFYGFQEGTEISFRLKRNEPRNTPFGTTMRLSPKKKSLILQICLPIRH